MSTKRVVHHGNSMELKEESMKYAKKLQELRQGITESRVRQNICRILDDYDFENYTEHPVREGRVDIYMPRHRVVIETKAPGSVSREDKAQVSRYVDRLAKEEWGIFSNDEKLPDFTGILTDGQVWYAWKYHTDTGKEIGQVLDGIRPQNARSLLRKFLLLWDHQPFGKPGISDNPREEFQSYLDGLRDVYEGLSGLRRTHTDTKLSLWLDMLRTSSMAPIRRSAQERLFVSHTFLVSLAKGVIHTVVAPNRDPNAKDLLGEGFIAWVLDSVKGKGWARDFLREINEWDWTRRQGDVLRPLYEAFVDEKDRKSFGEFYTPDWLAQLMVQEVLDDNWCKEAIASALRAQHDPNALNGVGVLDPACGSGTFLYFAVKRLLESKAMEELAVPVSQQSGVVASLVNGIDVHPVAAEMARATLIRALRWNRESDSVSLRIYEGDSLQVPRPDKPMYRPSPTQTAFVSPDGKWEILLPQSFIYRVDFANSVQRLVETAKTGHECPKDIIAIHGTEEQEMILEAHSILTDIIKRAGNSVWTWYIVNMSGPYQLSQRKVNRIVANPPWVSMAGVKVKARKEALIDFADYQLKIWSGGKNAPHFDIAQLFVKRCRELYLKDPDYDPAAWLVKLAARTSGGWKKFREDHRSKLIQVIDLTDAKPFGGGDARRCCILFECREVLSLSAIRQIREVVVRLIQSGHRPKPHMDWSKASRLLKFETALVPFPSQPSKYYRKKFRQGATVTPMALTIVDQILDETERESKIKTAKSMHPPWKDIGPQTGTFPRNWIRYTLRSQRLLPFAVESELDHAIIPTVKEASGEYVSSAPDRVSESWKIFDEIYREYRGKGKDTPQTLIDRIDYHKGISFQFNEYRGRCRGEPTKVVYPASGDIMRAARMIPSKAIVDSSIYWFIARNEDEAAFLVGVLNSSALTEAFADSRTSGRTFHKNPWRKIPIPKFESDNNTHRSIAEITRRAESLAATVIDSSNEKMGGGDSSPFIEGKNRTI